ncbi:MAG TPA: Rad52/Rad22 family DNA repair protein [Verrucomicrobiae bacterium]|nr:Rad52/Rad22 family DNA repair protein [Verrucomicrobiae bacterium]
MTATKKNPASVRGNGVYTSGSSDPAIPLFSTEKVRELIAELEVPFHPSLVEWQITSTSDDGTRGKIVPYAGQRTYTDRLNEIFTPVGWTRRYTITTSANFERSEDKKLVAKVFVTCDLIIHGMGAHSATGEEWADDNNAGTSAEAQAFKRACSCFGLGRYLYFFTGKWVDLDERKRPKEIPALFGWATPSGWRKGLRLPEKKDEEPSDVETGSKGASCSHVADTSAERNAMIQKIEAMAEPLGKVMYRGLLKTSARVWKPSQIRDVTVLQSVLASMESAERGLRRVEDARAKVAPPALKSILKSLKLKSIDQVNHLEMLHRLVLVLEEPPGPEAAMS